MNTYGYVAGNPLGYNDPFGLLRISRPTLPRTPFGLGTGTVLDFYYPPIGSKFSPSELPDGAFPGRHGIIHPDDGILACYPENAGKCKALIEQMYRELFGKKRCYNKGTLGIVRRMSVQCCDPGDFYNSNKKEWNKHNTQISDQIVSLNRLIDQARKLGCIIPDDILFLLDFLGPISKPYK